MDYNLCYSQLICRFSSHKNIYNKNGSDFYNLEIIWDKQKLIFPDNIKSLIKNLNKRFLIIPIGIEIDIGYHSNILISYSFVYPLVFLSLMLRIWFKTFEKTKEYQKESNVVNETLTESLVSNVNEVQK